MSLFFGFATPKTVLMVVPGKGAASLENRTLQAHRARHGFAALTSLRAFGNGREEDLRQTATFSAIHPFIVRLNASREVLHGHRASPFRLAE
jgi:hypothetical protein